MTDRIQSGKSTEKAEPAHSSPNSVVRRSMVVGAESDSAEHEADHAARLIMARLRADNAGSPVEAPDSRIQRSSFADPTSAARPQVIRRAYVKGTAAKDAPLFEKVTPVDKPIPIGSGTQAGKLGITATNMKHYLERHTFKYQRLNSKTIKPAAGMFPQGTTVDNVYTWLIEALGKLPDTATIGESAVSTSVTLANGLKVNLGALKGGKLSAFFPIEGGSNAGYHKYSADELKAIRDAKNAAGNGS